MEGNADGALPESFEVFLHGRLPVLVFEEVVSNVFHIFSDHKDFVNLIKTNNGP